VDFLWLRLGGAAVFGHFLAQRLGEGFELFEFAFFSSMASARK